MSGVSIDAGLGWSPSEKVQTVSMYRWDTGSLTWVKVSGGTTSGPDVNVTNFPASQPISGTVTANQGTAGVTRWLVDGSGVTQPVSGTITANAGTNLNTSLLALDTTLTGGNTKVKITGNAGGLFDAATAAAVPANALYLGVRAITANPTNSTGGNLVGAIADKAGRLVTTPGHVRDLVGTQTTTISASAAETTIITAGAAGVFNDISALIITWSGTAVATWSLRDATAGTVRAVFDSPATVGTAPLILHFPVPLPQTTAASNWTLTASTATSTGAHIYAVYLKNT